MKKWIIKTVALVMIVVMAVCVSACGAQKKEMEETVLNLVEALKTWDMEAAGEFIDSGELEFSGMDSLDGGDEVLASVFGALECKVISCDKKGSADAVVTAELTTIDLTAVLGQSTMKVLQEFAMGEIQEEEIDARTEEIFKEAINGKNLEKVTTKTEVLLKKTDKKWRVIVDKAFQDAISGGFLGAVNSAQSALFKTE